MNRALLVLVLLIILLSGSVGGKPKARLVARGDQKVERADLRPDLAVQFDGVAQLKIALRKSSYHLHELIALDIALLNTSPRPLFFRNLSSLQIKVQNSVGQPLRVQDYGVADRAMVPSSFVRLPSNKIIVRSFQLLAGCDKRAFAQFAVTEDDDLRVFKSGSFLNWGDACLPATQLETYVISVELKNDFVLFSSLGKVRTAVGRIKSNSLNITIGN